jgi:hypothetical protein
MTVQDFLLSRPCLEEVDGFIEGAKILERELTPGDWDQINEYRISMMRGDITPYDTRMPRAYAYRIGRPPVKNGSKKGKR